MSIYPINNAQITGRLIVAGLVAVVFCTGWLLGLSRATAIAGSANLADSHTNSRVSLLRQENLRLADEVKLLSGQRFTNEQAILELQSTVTDLRLKRSREREELALFRNLAQGKARTGGIFIEPLKVEAQGNSQYKIEVVMTQPRGRKRVNGTVVMVIEGLDEEGESVAFNISDLAQAPAKAIRPSTSNSEATNSAAYPAFDFRYFADFAFNIELPQGFVPESLTVAAKPENPHSPAIKSVRRIFPWDTADLATDAEFTTEE